ncbi:1-acyl-sn-glycerol-3-phosphate acyltransferase [bacterium]|nr:1-acyl-sn-glycerol-3-phosphate acyltransferase [bacterium]
MEDIKEKETTEKKERNYAKRTAKDYHIFRTIFYYFILYTVVFPYITWFYKVKIIGRKNLPKERKLLYVPNHVSEMDPPMVGWAIKRPIAFMAKKELFEDDKRSWLIKRLGAFAVNREKPEIATFKTSKEVLKTSWGLGIFPQGGTRKNKKIEDIHKGFVVFAKSMKADIVPISVCGLEEYSKKFRGKEVKIVIGKPISYKLDEDEIIQKWCADICENTGYENCMAENNEKIKEEIINE